MSYLADECHENVFVGSPVYNQGNSTATSNTITAVEGTESNAVPVEPNGLANGVCHPEISVRGNDGRPIFKDPCSPTDLSPSSTGNNKHDSSGNNHLPNGKVAYKPTTWLLAECQNGKVVRNFFLKYPFSFIGHNSLIVEL